MARRPTGSPRFNKTRKTWEARLSIGGRRIPVPFQSPPCARPTRCRLASGDVCENCVLAIAHARALSDRAQVLGAVPVETGLTVNEWVLDWFIAREERGLATVGDDRSRYENHVRGRLGPIAIAAVSRDHLEALVEDLDRKIVAGELSWKTASHVWGLVTVMFADACNAKRRSLRARGDNPAKDVHGPERGESKAKAYLYPAESAKLMACGRVTVAWRRMFAITTYLYARAGEVNALTWADVDIERGIVLIHASANRRTGELSTTKSERTRRIPIELELLPLLRAMRAEAAAWLADAGLSPENAAKRLRETRVSPTDATDKKLSVKLRRCLRLAGVDRAELFVERDATRKALTFHDLRSTGLTWCAVRGDEPLKIMQRAGHADFATTQGYIREAENLRDGDFGEPFPTLPPELLEKDETGNPPPVNWAGIGPVGGETPKTSSKGWRRRESKAKLERRETTPEVGLHDRSDAAESPANKRAQAVLAIAPDVATEATQLGHGRRGEPERSRLEKIYTRRTDTVGPDEAIRAAAKAAIDDGQTERAVALLALLGDRDVNPSKVPPGVIDLGARRRAR